MGLPDATDIHAELTRIAAMNIEELREMWREKRKHEPPAAFTKDLMARAFAHWLQEERLGGLETPLRRLLTTVAKKGSTPSRRLKIGSVIVREYQGKAQEVLVVPGGFCWEGRIYPSLSTIALKITGTNWNGPRFFGLRGAEESERLPDAEKTTQSRALPTRSQFAPAGIRPSRPFPHNAQAATREPPPLPFLIGAAAHENGRRQASAALCDLHA